ncbi:MAG: zinc ABC transporter substrate-binding protein [Verrucomicrobia bacterium]|nr:zinc ABC transporter substrate-binding protein [Verrucomicrobiota bacterium]
MLGKNTNVEKFLLGMLIAASAINAQARGKLQVVATTSDLASLTGSVSGDCAKVDYICSGKEDPHHLQARPKYIMMARKADLWICVGMDLEIGWEMPVIDGSRNRKIRPGMTGHLNTSAHIKPLEVPDLHLLSRAMGDVHAQGNPHYMLDPYNARIIAADIADRLSQLDPANAESYRANAIAFQTELDRRMFGEEAVEKMGGDKLWASLLSGEEVEAGGWVAAMKPLKGQSIVTYHKSWIYFANRFGLNIAAELEPKPGIPPSPAHLGLLVELVKAKQIGTILQEPYYSRKAAERVAGKTGAKIVVAPNSTGGDSGADDYLALIDLIVARLTES